MLCQPKVKQRFSLHCRCIFGGRQNLLVYVHIAMAAIFVSMTYISLKDLGEKKKQPFIPQPLNCLEFNMAVRQAETFAPPQKMSAMRASKLKTKLFYLRTLQWNLFKD